MRYGVLALLAAGLLAGCGTTATTTPSSPYAGKALADCGSAEYRGELGGRAPGQLHGGHDSASECERDYIENYEAVAEGVKNDTCAGETMPEAARICEAVRRK